MKGRIVGLSLAVLLGLPLAGCSTGKAAPRTVGLAPGHDVFDGDIGDPFMLPVKSSGGQTEYFVFGTNDNPAHVPTARSSDLVHWERIADALPELPPWAAPDPTNSLTWAPAVVHKTNRYLMYVTVPEAASGRECVAAMSSRVPEGPYADAVGAPLLCQRDLGGSIDPTVVTEKSGTQHLLWKNDGNCCALPVGIWEQDLAPDGLHLTGSAHRLIGADQPWEGGVIEEPAMLPAGRGGWWLFYSGNLWNLAAYGTGLAYCPRIEGPCQKTGSGPVLATTDGQASPGGLETFVDAKGARWVVYATWNRPARNGRFYCCRSLDLARVNSS
jgi:beta-xylosidase